MPEVLSFWSIIEKSILKYNLWNPCLDQIAGDQTIMAAIQLPIFILFLSRWTD